MGDGTYGVLGRSSTAGGIGVWGQHFGIGPALVGHNVSSAASAGPGIHAKSEKGYGGLFEGGTAQLRLVPSATAGKPTSGAHQKGEIYMDSKGALFVCSASGTPGAWRKVTTRLV